MTTIPRRVLVVSTREDHDSVTSALSHWAIVPFVVQASAKRALCFPTHAPLSFFVKKLWLTAPIASFCAN
jgi:hypothetical protein